MEYFDFTQFADIETLALRYVQDIIESCEDSIQYCDIKIKTLYKKRITILGFNDIEYEKYRSQLELKDYDGSQFQVKELDKQLAIIESKLKVLYMLEELPVEVKSELETKFIQLADDLTCEKDNILRKKKTQVSNMFINYGYEREKELHFISNEMEIATCSKTALVNKLERYNTYLKQIENLK